MILSDASMRKVNGAGAPKDRVLRLQRPFPGTRHGWFWLLPACSRRRWRKPVSKLAILCDNCRHSHRDRQLGDRYHRYQYSAAVNGQTSGLLSASQAAKATPPYEALCNGGRTLSSIYTATISATEKGLSSIRIAISNGNVKEYTVKPPAAGRPGACADHRGIITAASSIR